ncbi:unnamed protein product [Mucor hiemalis]
MGNCCGSESHEPEGHQLQTTKNTPSKSSAGQTLGGSSPSGGSDSREAMLSAAEQRRVQAENRGVKEGGKLSKQLADQKKQSHSVSPKNEADDRLVVCSLKYIAPTLLLTLAELLSGIEVNMYKIQTINLIFNLIEMINSLILYHSSPSLKSAKKCWDS